MMRILVMILIVVPTLEIWGLLTAGRAFGWLPTLAMCVFTGVVGAWLAKREGLQIFKLAQLQMSRGQLPGEAILDGICVFTGGIFLMLPGFFTDIIGFFLIFPYTRGISKIFIKRWLWRKVQSGSIQFFK
ncbi:membrane protein FxsA [Aneurinibacillus sp. Ricciae_BoGa-3]|uniref:FxsA family protein n=1 Tax=Aneurinibacillus sp. Ricciae_BoGa-3 TaxID=3022697 RepID=UPI0023425E2E|nr:FxsA family protein [Aneurinibacillus sp. Ricciae_BoGa-3]WCK55513.1 membrane protein FxsA [Aneurinibacillus sp. Ricciae_BoGa-3]